MYHKLFCTFVLLLTISACSASEQKIKLRKTEEPSIKYLVPDSPVKIELKYSKGKYSWTIKSDNLDKIIKADKRLREYTSKVQKHP